MLKSKFVWPALILVLILLYVPHAGTNAQQLQHKLGRTLTSVGHGVGQFVDGLSK